MIPENITNLQEWADQHCKRKSDEYFGKSWYQAKLYEQHISRISGRHLYSKTIQRTNKRNKSKK